MSPCCLGVDLERFVQLVPARPTAPSSRGKTLTILNNPPLVRPREASPTLLLLFYSRLSSTMQKLREPSLSQTLTVHPSAPR